MEAWYGAGSFLTQCKQRFGVEIGTSVWEEVNKAFDCMPLAAVVDDHIFCAHGGVPRPVPVPAGRTIVAPTPPQPTAFSSSASGFEAGVAACRSPRTPRMKLPSGGTPSTVASSALAAVPDLRMHALAHAPVPLPLMVVPARKASPVQCPPSPASPGAAGPGQSPLSDVTNTTTPGGHTPDSASGLSSAGGLSVASSVSLLSSAGGPSPLCVSPGADDARPVSFDGPTSAIDDHPYGRTPFADLLTPDVCAGVAMDLLWADPASADSERSGALNDQGFGTGLRGGETVAFGEAAVQNFLRSNNFQLVVRAHQATAAGFGICKSATGRNGRGAL